MAITDIAKLLVTHRTDDVDLIPLSAPTTDLGENSTSIATGLAIGFTFTFDGVDYTTCALSSKGFLRLAGTVTSSSNSNLFGSNVSVVLAPWWDDMETVTSGGYIKHETQGTAPWRRFVAEWYVNFNTASGASDYIRAKMQCVLYESTGRFDFRYGTFESGGSGVNTSSGSIGCKGDTTGSADNYLDFAVDDRDLGGSQTTSTTNLRAYTNEWPTYTIVVEPNWPMVGFYTDTDEDTLTGIQSPYGDPLWSFCAAVNWLYCRFTPDLINFSPYTLASDDNPIYVVPIPEPSADSLDYRVWIEIYTTPGGDVAVVVDRDNAADPQPGTGGDWSNLASPSPTTSIGAASYASMAAFDITLTSSLDIQFLRFKFTGNGLRVLSINVAPVPLDDFDPAADYPSGFVPMGIGQFRQQGSAVHPEIYNRAYRNCARITADRKQMLWSFGHSDDTSLFGFTGTLPVRMLGVAPASLRTWEGQQATTVVYAYDSSNNGKLTFSEKGGFSAPAFDVDTNGSEYRRQDGSLPLLGDQPTITLTADPSGTLHCIFAGVYWSPSFTDEDLILGLTPAPKLEYLASLSSRIRRACLYSYAMAGLATLLRVGSAGYYRCAWMVPPATAALRAKVMRSNQDGKTSGTATQATVLIGASSGSGGDDEIHLASPFSAGRDEYPPDHETALVSTSNVFDATPSDASDRLLESPTAGVLTGPSRELVRVLYGVGICLVPVPDDPTA